MGAYKPVLQAMERQFNSYYKEINKKSPYLSKEDKANKAICRMSDERDNCDATFMQHIQYRMEIYDLVAKVSEDLRHFYMPDYSLFEWMQTAPVKKSNMNYFYEKIDNLDINHNTFAVYTKEKSVVISFFSPKTTHWLKLTEEDANMYLMSVLYDDMHYTAILDYLDYKKMDSLDEDSDEIKAFRLAMNFLFYLDAFPDCVIDGVPNEVKKDSKSKIVKISPKVISNSGEHFVSPHFRSGHFRHLDSDYYVNKKGSVVFIPSTMVKGKAKTVIGLQN